MIYFKLNLKDKTPYIHNNKQKYLIKENINNILNLIAMNIMNLGVDKNGYTLVHSSELINVNWQYNVYVGYLIADEVIKRDYYENTEEKKKPFGYRFTERFKEHIEISEITFPSKLIKHRKKIKKYNGDDMNINSSVYNRLIKDFLSADVIYNLKKEQIEKTKDEWGNFYDIKKWLHNNDWLNKWSKGYVFFKWSKERLYTTFTYLSSHIRLNNIQLNNEKLVELDIASSFPLMFAKYCLNEKPKIFNDPDFESYCTSVINGTFYNDLMRGLNSIRNTTKGDNETDYSTRLLSKKETKILFQIYLNGNKNKVHFVNGVRCDINRYMEHQYPSIHKILNEIKDSGKKPYYDIAPIETKIIFEIIEELYDTYDDIKVLTCHDAIYVPASFEERTRIIWDKHLDSIKSKLPVENYDIDESALELLGIVCEDDDVDAENGCL